MKAHPLWFVATLGLCLSGIVLDSGAVYWLSLAGAISSAYTLGWRGEQKWGEKAVRR